MVQKPLGLGGIGEAAIRQAELLQRVTQQQRQLQALVGPMYAATKQWESIAAIQRHLMPPGLDQGALAAAEMMRRATLNQGALAAADAMRRAMESSAMITRLAGPLVAPNLMHHARIHDSLRLYDRMATQTVSQFMRTLGVQQEGYARVLSSTVTQALGSWQSAIGTDVVTRLQQRLAEEAEAEPETPIQEVVAKAVAAALEERDQRVDMRFVAQIILAVLMMLIALPDSNQQQQQLDSIQQTVVQIEAQLARQKSVLDLLLTKEVTRGTPMRSRPSRQGNRIGWVEPGTAVIVFQRHGKWTRVGLVEAQDAATSGWILNKYLK